MCSIERFSTRDMAPQWRLPAWGREAWAPIGGLEIHALDAGEDFEGEINTLPLGPLRLCRISVGRHRAERTPRLVRADDRDLLQAVFPLEGSSYIRQGERKAILHPGSWCLCDTSLPYRAVVCAQAQFLVALLPRSRLASVGIDPARHVLRPRTTLAGVDRLLLDSLLSAMDRTGNIAAQSAVELGSCLAEMLRIALLDGAQEPPRRSTRQPMLERIDAFVRQHLRDPDLSIDRIAADLRCTKRYLHKIFRGRGETLSQYIRGLRLERCAADLSNPELAGHSITELSYRWGFSDSAHFSRTFKTRFGVPPRSYRTPPAARPLLSAA